MSDLISKSSIEDSLWQLSGDIKGNILDAKKKYIQELEKIFTLTLNKIYKHPTIQSIEICGRTNDPEGNHLIVTSVQCEITHGGESKSAENNYLWVVESLIHTFDEYLVSNYGGDFKLMISRDNLRKKWRINEL